MLKKSYKNAILSHYKN